MSFHSYRVVFYAPIPTGPRTSDFGSCSMSYSLQTARGRYSGALRPYLSPLQGWVSGESFLYGPSRHVEHVWAKIPQFHRRLGRGQQSHLLIINRWERRCPFECGKDYYIFNKICQGTLYEFSFLQGSILCTYSNGTKNFRFWFL